LSNLRFDALWAISGNPWQQCKKRLILDSCHPVDCRRFLFEALAHDLDVSEAKAAELLADALCGDDGNAAMTAAAQAHRLEAAAGDTWPQGGPTQ